MTNATKSVPEGYSTMQSRTPFFDLAPGESLNAEIIKVREKSEEKTVKSGKGGKAQKIQVTKMYYDLRLLEESAGNDGSKNHTPVVHGEGDVVTFSGSGDLDRQMHRASLAFAKKDLTKLPTTREEWPEAQWEELAGQKVFIRRDQDGKMRGGDFAGNKVKQYTVAFAGLPTKK